VKKRIFIAIDISDETREAAANYIKRMSEEFPNAPIKWERPEKLHLTIKFLGSTEDATIPDVIDLVSQNAQSSHPFEIGIGDTSAFPSAKNPRILWLGVSESTGALKDLAEQIDKDCAALGFESETRAFKPHLTMARVRDPKHAGEIGTAHAANQFGPFRFTCDRLSFMKAISAAVDRRMKSCTLQSSAVNHSAHAASVFAAYVRLHLFRPLLPVLL
jgi:2''-5'' RNA ligase